MDMRTAGYKATPHARARINMITVVKKHMQVYHPLAYKPAMFARKPSHPVHHLEDGEIATWGCKHCTKVLTYEQPGSSYGGKMRMKHLEDDHPDKPFEDWKYCSLTAGNKKVGRAKRNNSTIGTDRENAALMKRMMTPTKHRMFQVPGNFRPHWGRTLMMCYDCGKMDHVHKRMRLEPCAERMITEAMNGCSMVAAGLFYKGAKRKWSRIRQLVVGKARKCTGPQFKDREPLLRKGVSQGQYSS